MRQREKVQEVLRSVVRFPFGGVFTGILLALAYPAWSLYPLAWIAFVPLLIDLYRFAGSYRRALWSGAWAGLVFFLISCYWVSHVSFFGYGILCVYLALYFIPFACIVSFLYKQGSSAILWGPAFFVALEFLRGTVFTGFPWNTLAASQARFLSFLQMASVVGSYGMSFFVLLANILLFEGALRWKGRSLGQFKYLAIGGLGMLICALVFGHRELALADRPSAVEQAPIRLAAIQPNIAQEQKWDPVMRDAIHKRLTELTKEAGLSHPHLIVWPETSVAGEVLHDDETGRFVQDLARDVGTPLLVGSQDWDQTDGQRDYFNAAVLVDPKNGMGQSYRKMHLVPFGEFLPGAKAFPFLRKWIPIAEDFRAGKEQTVMRLRGRTLRWQEGDGTLRSEMHMTRFGIAICFEDIFSEPFRRACMQNLDFMVNMTNDAWFKNSGASRQHAHLAILRAVENRIFLLRATNTGYTCLIDPYGRIRAQVRKNGSIFVPGFLHADVIPLHTRTLFNQSGDMLAYACLVFMFLKSYFVLRGPKRK